jgi:hypothetical protein
MLENLSRQVQQCLRLAEDCARKAALQSDPKLRQDFQDMEARWLKLARSYELTERLTAFSRTGGIFYSIHVRRKTGEWGTEVQIRLGKLPKPGDEVVTILCSETVKARVLAIATNPSKAKGEHFVEVHAKEI